MWCMRRKLSSTISTDREEAFVFLTNLASLCRTSLLLASIGKVKSLPVKCLSSGIMLKNPAQSSVAKRMFFPFTLFTNSLQQDEVRAPNSHPRTARGHRHQSLSKAKFCFFPLTKCHISSIRTMSLFALFSMGCMFFPAALTQRSTDIGLISRNFS